jgi:uncharacterized protein with ATP-grasp and redox domains
MLKEPDDSQLLSLESRFFFDELFLAIRINYIDKGFSGAKEPELVFDFDAYCEKREKISNANELLDQLPAPFFKTVQVW